MFTAEQKSQLAKLMATENLTIQHQKMRTAKFDPQNRILYLPVWQNMSGYMYDLLCGHEVGHALYTPADGWHDVATDKTKGKSYKSFLNVVEDARIEKKVKRRYPGLKTSFQKAYQDLTERDFFGLKGRDVNKMSFIDRLNLFTKSQYTSDWIEFSAQEMVFVRKVENLETWEDVLRVTNEIYEYSKTEQNEIEMNDFQNVYSSSDSNPDDEYEEIDGDGDDGDENADGDGNEDDDSDNDAKNKADGEEADGEESDGETNEINRSKESSESTEDQFQPKCETDENYRRNETMLLDEKCKEYEYIQIPKPILKNIVTPAKRVHELLTKEFDSYMQSIPYINYGKPFYTQQQVTEWVNEFKNKNDRYIGLLAKEFEMRKAAKSFSKSKLSDTGDIDINKLSSYKFDDNIFRKVMLTPKGKNHGLILLLDKSGSMTNNMAGSIEQILVLSMFCRKVNIPFTVYGFGDSVSVRILDLGIAADEYRENSVDEKHNCFEKLDGNLGFSSMFLREYLNSKMNNSEFTKAIRNMILLKKSFESRSYSDVKVPRPDSEHLSNTPLTQALVATAEIMKKFRKDNNLDITNLVIVHDGDADYCSTIVRDKEYRNYSGELQKIKTNESFDFGKNNVICDRANKIEYKMTKYDRSDLNTLILDWFRKVTNSKIFGFYLTDSTRQSKNAIDRYYVDENKQSLHEIRMKNYHGYYDVEKNLLKKMKEQKFIQSNLPGFDSFFIISGGNSLITENEEMEITGNITANKLKTAFMKYNKKKTINRVLVSRFITGIAV